MRIERGMAMLERAKKQGAKFLAPVDTKVGGLRIILKAIPMMVRNKAETVPRVQPGPFRTDVEIYRQEAQSGLRVTWFGHSGLLVEMDGVRVLVDPVWDERAGPVTWAGPKRFFAPTMQLEEMPQVDAVLISHDHYDHLGKATVRALAKRMPEVRWVTALGVGRILRGFGAQDVTELDWTEKTLVAGRDGAELRVTAVPARHFSGRTPWNRNETLWEAFVLQGAKHTVYCGADSGLWEGFATIAAEYGPFDLTMLEIGAFNELWKDIHLGPDGAVEAFQQMGGGMLMPIHWGLFDLALHGWREPIERLEGLAGERGIRLFSPEPGVPTEVVSGDEVRSGWWWDGVSRQSRA